MDIFEAYKEIKDRSLFNIIPEKYHFEVLEKSSLVTLVQGEEHKLRSTNECLYIVFEGAINLYEKERKLRIKAKSVTKGRSLELENCMRREPIPTYRWEIDNHIIALEIPLSAIFEIFEKDKIFHSYLQKVLSAFELRKLKNDLRLFGFDEDEIQKTFFCLEEDQGTLENVENAICIIRESYTTFYYFFDNDKKVLGQFEYGDFFVWCKSKKINYEMGEKLSFWRLEEKKWAKFIAKEKVDSFMQLVDPFKGKLGNLKTDNSVPEQIFVVQDQQRDLSEFFQRQHVDFSPFFLTTSDPDKSGLISTLALLKSFKIKIDEPYLNTLLPFGLGGSSLYDIRKIFSTFGFKTYMGKVSYENLQKVNSPFIVKYQDRHIVVYECKKNNFFVLDPLVGQTEISHKDFFKHASMLVLIVQRGQRDENGKNYLELSYDYLKIVWQSKKELFFIFLASVLIFLLSLVLPVVIQVIFDIVLVNKDQNMLRQISLMAMSLLFFSSLLIMVRSYLITYMTTLIDAKFSAIFFDRLLRLNRRFYEKFSAGDIISRLNELKKIRKFFTAKTFKLLIDLMSAIMFIFILGFYHFKLLLFVLVLLPFVFIHLKVFTPQIVKTLNLLYLHGSEAQSYLLEHLRSFDIVKAYGMSYKARQMWEKQMNKVLSQRKRFELLNSLVGVGSDFFLQFIPLAVILFAIYLHLIDELTLGQVIASSTIVSFIVYPVINLVKYMDEFKQVSVSFRRINEVVATASEQSSQVHSGLSHSLNTLALKDVFYQYGDEVSAWVLKNINIKIEVGKNYAFIGKSGAGKTTMAQLLVGADQLINGLVEFNGVDIKELSFDFVRKNVIYIGAEPQIFSGTIVDNIVLSENDASLERIIESAKIADAHDFISSLPEGYMTLLGEGGEGLSLGQKQKINIARALYCRPRVLILDEATAVFDQASERNIFQNLKDFMKEKTIITVTHRLDILGDVDHIYVMNQGEITEEGTHNQLVSKQGRYYEMWKDLMY